MDDLGIWSLLPIGLGLDIVGIELNLELVL